MYSMTIKSASNSTMMNSKTKQTQTLPKLSAGFKKRWVDALRSGNYIQSHSSKLVDYNPNYHADGRTGYSPIGVAFRTSGVPFNQLENTDYFNGTFPFVPKELCGKSPIVEKINHLNSHKKMSFRWIASYIERYL